MSKLGADLAIVFTLALLQGEMNMMALAVLNWCPAYTTCQAKDTHRLATLNILDVLKKTEQGPITMGYRQALKVMVIHIQSLWRTSWLVLRFHY